MDFARFVLFYCCSRLFSRGFLVVFAYWPSVQLDVSACSCLRNGCTILVDVYNLGVMRENNIPLNRRAGQVPSCITTGARFLFTGDIMAEQWIECGIGVLPSRRAALDYAIQVIKLSYRIVRLADQQWIVEIPACER